MHSYFDESRNTHSRDVPDIKKASLLSLIIIVVVVFCLQKIMGEIMKGLAPQGNLLKLAVISQLVISIFLPVCLALVILRLPVRHSLGLYPPPWKKTLLAVIIGLALIFGVNIILPLIIQPSQQLVQATGSIVAYHNIPEFLLTLLTITIFAAGVDEIFFRGILLRGLMVRYGNIVAILATALLTALFHTLEPFKLAHAFLMGIIFATSVVWTRSLYTSFILHALHNSLALLPLG